MKLFDFGLFIVNWFESGSIEYGLSSSAWTLVNYRVLVEKKRKIIEWIDSREMKQVDFRKCKKIDSKHQILNHWISLVTPNNLNLKSEIINSFVSLTFEYIFIAKYELIPMIVFNEIFHITDIRFWGSGLIASRFICLRLALYSYWFF